MLSGCSEKKIIVDNTETAPSSNNQKPIALPEDKPQSPKELENDTDSNILDSIDTTSSPFEKGYYDYQGTISNNMPIYMTVYPLGKDLVGSYFYESQRKEINLKGKAGEKEIILYEYDETGKKTGVFKGTMSTVDKIEGTWSRADNKKSYPFTLSLVSILPGAEYGKRYAGAINAASDQDVEEFARKIQSYVLNENKEQLSKEIKYPITVKIDDKATTIQSKDEFIKNYDKIFHSKYKQAITSAITEYMFVNWQGVMFGTGTDNIWINEETDTNGNPKLMIIAINNLRQ